jgi:methyltransferase-like protein 6
MIHRTGWLKKVRPAIFIAKMTLQYHDNDFDYQTWSQEAGKIHSLPSISNENTPVNEKHDWDSFFKKHNTGNFFKARNYLFAEFQKWLSLPELHDKSKENSLTIVEVGSGHGCSMYPLIKILPQVKYIATDYSIEALTILKENSNYNDSRIKTALWDVTVAPDLDFLFKQPVDIVLCIFALSAVNPEYHIAALNHMAAVLKPNGVILFRDYGIHDMTMYRHTLRYSENLYLRNDKTLAYYFDIDYLRKIASICNLTIMELEYATVEVQNRKTKKSMKRVFIHAVLQKSDVS